MAIEIIELLSISRGLVKPGDGLKCDGVFEPALWNALFCRQIIQHRRNRDVYRIGYELRPEISKFVLSEKAEGYWLAIHSHLLTIVDHFVSSTTRKPLFGEEEVFSRDTESVFHELTEKCNEFIRECFRAEDSSESGPDLERGVN